MNIPTEYISKTEDVADQVSSQAGWSIVAHVVPCSFGRGHGQYSSLERQLWRGVLFNFWQRHLCGRVSTHSSSHALLSTRLVSLSPSLEPLTASHSHCRFRTQLLLWFVVQLLAAIRTWLWSLSPPTCRILEPVRYFMCEMHATIDTKSERPSTRRHSVNSAIVLSCPSTMVSLICLWLPKPSPLLNSVRQPFLQT